MMYHRLTVLFLILLAIPSSTFGQFVNASELWRVRAQTITDDLLKDATHLKTQRRAVVWVRLAQLWWRDDPGRARTWITNAIEVVEQVPNRESPQERQQRLDTAKLLLHFTAPLDQKLSKRLITLLTDVDQSTSVGERAARADSLINAAVFMVERDPKRAAELGSVALRLGSPTDIAALLFPLRARDPKLAGSLFEQALSTGRQHPEPSLLDSLTYVAFPVHKGLSGQVPIVSDKLRAELLALHVAFLNQHPNELGTSFCFNVASFIAPVLPEFDRLLPQQAVLVQQTVQKCRSFNFVPAENSSGTQQLDSVDAFLQAAADTKIIGVRTHNEYRAAQLAKNQKDYDRAIKILDNMTDEARALMASTWDVARADWAATAALEHYRNDRLVEMNAVLNAVPPRARPLAKMTFVDRLPAKTRPEGAPTIQFLNEAREDLRRAGIPDREKYGLYFDLLHLTIRHQPTDAGPVLKDAIAALNRGISEDSKFLDGTEFSNALPASLLETDEFGLKEILASVTSVEARAQLRLQLLKDTLERMTKR